MPKHIRKAFTEEITVGEIESVLLGATDLIGV
jgi:hypothetical protein